MSHLLLNNNNRDSNEGLFSTYRKRNYRVDTNYFIRIKRNILESLFYTDKISVANLSDLVK